MGKFIGKYTARLFSLPILLVIGAPMLAIYLVIIFVVFIDKHFERQLEILFELADWPLDDWSDKLKF